MGAAKPGTQDELPAAVVDVEATKLQGLQHRFDTLFTLGGDERLMDEQEQWIAPNRLRVIWR